MTRKSIIAFIIFPFLALLLVFGCTKEETYPVTPEITFKSLEIFQSVSQNDSVVLTFSFTDGDGDIGTPKEDTINTDVFVSMYELKEGVFVKYDDPFGALNYRVPFLEPRGNNKSLKGDIRINIDYNIFEINDTIRYELFMKDRAGHVSNVIGTSTIITRVQ